MLNVIHIMAKIVTSSGNSKLVFIGFEEPAQREAKGYFYVIQLSIEKLMLFEKLLPILLLFATNGASINVRQKNRFKAIVDSNKNLNCI